MKNITIAVLLLVVTISSTNAQVVLDKVKTGDISSVASSFDVKSIASSMMGTLTPALGLTDTENPGVLSEVTTLLTKKKDILGLQATDKAAYTSKMGMLASGFMGKMKTLLTAAKYAKLLGLKPKTSSAGNVLSQLFF